MTLTPSVGLSKEAVRGKARHVLYVEGTGYNSFDYIVVRELLENTITVEPFGPAYSLENVSRALHKSHPTYFFVIDRDHRSDDDINRLWENFPDPTTHNLLVWHKKELENYFLDHDFLSKSSYHDKTKNLEQCILAEAQKHLYFSAANLAITFMRENMKQRWINHFENKDLFTTSHNAELALRELGPIIRDKSRTLQNTISIEMLLSEYRKYLAEMTGGCEPLQSGKGRWSHLINGKEVFKSVVNLCFKLKDNNGRLVQKNAHIEIARQLISDCLKHNKNALPADFIALHELIRTRIILGR